MFEVFSDLFRKWQSKAESNFKKFHFVLSMWPLFAVFVLKWMVNLFLQYSSDIAIGSIQRTKTFVIAYSFFFRYSSGMFTNEYWIYIPNFVVCFGIHKNSQLRLMNRYSVGNILNSANLPSFNHWNSSTGAVIVAWSSFHCTFVTANIVFLRLKKPTHSRSTFEAWRCRYTHDFSRFFTV